MILIYNLSFFGDILIIYLLDLFIIMILESMMLLLYYLFFILDNLIFILGNDFDFLKFYYLKMVGCNLFDVVNFLL